MQSTGTSFSTPEVPALSPQLLRLREKAEELEASFLSEMLAYSGIGTQKGEFTGGVGEEQFASFLRDAQAKLIAQRGGLGLAETIFDSLVKSQVAK